MSQKRDSQRGAVFKSQIFPSESEAKQKWYSAISAEYHILRYCLPARLYIVLSGKLFYFVLHLLYYAVRADDPDISVK